VLRSTLCGWSAIITVLTLGCADDAETSAGGGGGPNGDDVCPPGNELIDDECVPAGIRTCGEGFVAAPPECVPTLPSAPCPEGTFATPGDASCRAPSACGEGTWGDIAIDGATQHVDLSFAGNDSDGSAAKPWLSIQAGVDAASAGALVAVAAGSYVEDIAIEGKPVRLHGRCAELVEIVGVGGALGSVLITTSADGSELRGLAITGPSVGLALSGSLGVIASALWIHDTGSRGVNVQDDLGATSLSLQDALVERSNQIGIFDGGATLDVEHVAVRDTALDVNGAFGVGISLETNAVTGSAADAQISSAHLVGNHDSGIFVTGSIAQIETTVITGTLPTSTGEYGRGIMVQNLLPTDQRASVTIRHSYIANNHDIGVFVMASDVALEDTVVRSTLPSALNGAGGRGINAQNFDAVTKGASVTLTHSLITDNHDSGVVIFGSELQLLASVVSHTKPRMSDGIRGRGTTIQFNPFDFVPSIALIRDSTVADNLEGGIVVLGASAILEHSAVHNTATNGAGEFGDGIDAIGDVAATSVTVRDSLVTQSARAGVACFGATVPLVGTKLECNPIQLNSEAFAGQSCMLDDQGGNQCGCGDAIAICGAKSSGLLPPPPVQ
jgi:hypothetical protein